MTPNVSIVNVNPHILVLSVSMAQDHGHVFHLVFDLPWSFGEWLLACVKYYMRTRRGQDRPQGLSGDSLGNLA